MTKGVVPTSQYVLSESSFILAKKEIEQKVWLKIIEGHIVQCVCNENSDPLVSLPDNALSDIIKHFKTLLTSTSVLVEFGVLFKEDSTYFPYLIDFVDNESSNMISLSDINTGIISRGRITGTISYVSQTSFSSLDVHLGDLEVAPTNDESCAIFFCDKPDISLLSIIHNYDKRRIGFVFAEGSVLCHLAVVLREMGIPAIKIGHYLEYEYKAGSICSIDAETPEISGKERIKV